MIVVNKREAQNISKNLVSLLFAECEKQKISMYKLAQETCLSYTSLLDIKKGRQMPTFYTLCVIADYLDFEFNLVSKK